MDKADAKIVKRGNKWCVVSEDGTKELGCSDTKDGAVQRLRQVEHYKSSKGNNMNYEEAFRNMAKSLHNGQIDPTEIGQSAESRPRQVHIPSDSIIEGFSSGSIAGQTSQRLLDKKDHFPVFTETQARSSMSRAMQLTEVPIWYNGNINDLRKDVFDGIAKAHPALVEALNVYVPISRISALSDGQIPSETTKKNIDNPADCVRTEVPGVRRPTITTAEAVKACEDEQVRVALAGQLMEVIEKQEADIQTAKKMATTLLKKGLDAKQFDALSTYLQSDILGALLYNSSANASVESRRLELLERLGKKNEQV